MTSLHKWKSLGLIFKPDSSKWWMRSHASLPVPVCLQGSVYRVFFSSRDVGNRSHVGWFDVDLDSPQEVLDSSNEPVLRPGPVGGFDDHGVYAASAAWCGEALYLYTIGWNPGARPPLFYASIGLAVSEDRGLSFHKVGRSPIMARSDHDPCLVTSPFVLRDDSGWHMYYVSGYRWEEVQGNLRSHYNIKYATSTDGISWKRDGHVCIDVVPPEERNIGRTSILKLGSKWEAWYSFTRGGEYRIGYAVSADGRDWDRRDSDAGLKPSGSEWDSEAQAYPWVLVHGGRRYMFYNGNRFGRDGVALAVTDG